MNFWKDLKKIGAAIIWPFTHAQMLEEMTQTLKKDTPELQSVVVGTFDAFEKIDANVTAAIAAGGVNFAADVASVDAVVAFFKYVKNTALPTIESAYSDFKMDAVGSTAVTAVPVTAAPTVAAPTAAAPTVTVAGPQVHLQTPA
jgi:hypothetical protein